MSRASAIARAHAYFDDGRFLADLSRRVAIPSSSQEPERAAALRSYLDDEIVPSLSFLGFTCRVFDNPTGGSPADFGRLIAAETEKWGKVIRAANIKPE
jgi:hypothetical protein